MARILIAYASKTGSTEEIAQAIGKELKAAGHTADVVGIGNVTSIQGYDAVLIGGPMYMGRIDGGVGKWVKHHYQDLTRVPVAGFVVCLAAATQKTRKVFHGRKRRSIPLLPLSSRSLRRSLPGDWTRRNCPGSSGGSFGR